jgi:hypothetical protein
MHTVFFTTLAILERILFVELTITIYSYKLLSD